MSLLFMAWWTFIQLGFVAADFRDRIMNAVIRNSEEKGRGQQENISRGRTVYLQSPCNGFDTPPRPPPAFLFEDKKPNP
jgi:hypothetical protein